MFYQKIMQKKIILLSCICLVGFTGYTQNKLVDSLVAWTVAHPAIDSQHIITLHRISYRLSETDTKKSFAYYEKVSDHSVQKQIHKVKKKIVVTPTFIRG